MARLTTTTPTYRMQMDLIAPRTCTPMIWRGRATDARLEEHVLAFEQSTLPGGCNQHLGPTHVVSARIVRQSTGDVVATFPRST